MASDGRGRNTTGYVTVELSRVQADKAPVFQQTPYTKTINVTYPANTVVYSVRAVDPDINQASCLKIWAELF